MTAQGIGPGNNRNFMDTVHLQYNSFDFRRGYIFSAHFEHVLGSVGETQLAVWV